MRVLRSEPDFDRKCNDFADESKEFRRSDLSVSGMWTLIGNRLWAKAMGCYVANCDDEESVVVGFTLAITQRASETYWTLS